jgi:cytidine deaminase
MISKEIRIPYFEYSGTGQINEEIGNLISLAKEAAEKAYAPYSGFHVGVAIQLIDGRHFTASNQENKAYPSGLCAERVGIFFVQANYPDVPIKRMVLLALQNGQLTNEPAFPCGACRQVMVEAQERQPKPFEIWIAGKSRILRVDSAEDLLPLKFVF